MRVSGIYLFIYIFFLGGVKGLLDSSAQGQAALGQQHLEIPKLKVAPSLSGVFGSFLSGT